MTVKPKTKNRGKTLVALVSQLEVDKILNVEQPKDLDVLADSIKALGVRHKLQVRRKKGSDKLYIIDGRRRFLAASKAGLRKIEVVDHGYMKDVDAITLGHAENFLRRKNSKKETIHACRLLRSEKLTHKEIASRLFLGESTVSEYLSISRASPKVKEAVVKKKSEGGVSIKEGLKIAQLGREQQDEEIQKKTKGVEQPAKRAQLPKILTNKAEVTPLSQNMGVLMPGEKLRNDYRLASDYKERCQKLEVEVQKRLRMNPSNAKLQGMSLAIGVLRGKLTVEESLINWGKI